MYNTSKYSSYIYADRNIRPCTIQGYTLATFPNVVQYIYAQPEKKQAKELCIIGGEYPDNRFSTQQYKIQGKLSKDKEGGNSQPSKHQKRTTLSFV